MDLLSFIFGGGATGILGVIAQRYFDHKNKQLDSEMMRAKMGHELALRKIDAEIMDREWQGRVRVAEVEGEGREAAADAQAFSASFNEPARYSADVHPSKAQGWVLVILDFIRGIVRPGLTMYLCALVTVIYFQARAIIGEGVPGDRAYDLLNMIIGTILYLLVTCVCWWFGVRNKQKAPGLR